MAGGVAREVAGMHARGGQDQAGPCHQPPFGLR